MTSNRACAVLAAAGFFCVPTVLLAQSWTPLAHAPTFNAGAMLLLTDGTVMVQDQGSQGAGTGNWWRLTPDATGSYVNGSWSQLATMPTGYKPLYFASAVLQNGSVIINGGEYNGSSNGVWTTKGALYDPVKDAWTSVSPPAGWTTIGDAQSVVLPNGTYMLANCCTVQEATLDLKTMAWTPTGTGKGDINDEEGWTLLPSGKVLTVDANDTANVDATEILTKGVWSSAGNTPVELPDLNTSTNSHELGPQILRPDGTVFAVGATGYTAIYHPATKSWSQGPTFPAAKSGLLYDSADGPASLLPDGNVLLAASPGVYKNGTKFWEFDGSALNLTANTPSGPKESSFQVRLLVLPTGQVLETDGSTSVQVYSAAGSANPAWKPVIATLSSTLTHGKTYKLTGQGLNGLSQAVGYGDDYQAATNYPIVRITNTATGHVVYARTAHHSSMAVASPKTVSTEVTVPSTIETGPSTVEAVANGIASTPYPVTVN